MKIGTTCSRSLAEDTKFLKECLLNAISKINKGKIKGGYLSFITGDAKSDDVCRKILESLGYDVHYLPPAHKLVNIDYSNNLYMARNMIIGINAEVLISIWDGTSPGTADTTKFARKIGKKIIQYVKIPNNPPLSKYINIDKKKK